MFRVISKKGGCLPKERPEEIIREFISGKTDVKGIYTDYHGVGILDTHDYTIIVETFPPRTVKYEVKI
jgi:hypothetical protein